MSYHLQPRRGKNKNSPLLIAVFIFLFVVLVTTFIPRQTSGLVSVLAEPVWKARDSVAGALVVSTTAIFGRSDIVKENIRLKDQIREMELKLLDRNLLREENLALKEVSGRSHENTLVPAGVLAKPGISPYDTFILDIGRDSDVSEGDNVLVGGTVLVGVIDRVFKGSSRARLYSTPGVSVPVVVGESNIHATAVGRGAGNFQIEIPKEIDVSEGDNIVSVGVGAKIFGVVESIEVSESGSFQRILFKSPVNMNSVNLVFIERASN